MEERQDLINRQAAIDAIQKHRENVLGGYEYDEGVAFVYAAAHNHIIDVVKRLPSAQPEITYQNCSDALLKMWMDNVLTDGEYNRIMDKLNQYDAERRTDDRSD